MALAADPEIDRLVRGQPGKDWVTNGGNLTNQRYSTLTQINATNVKQLKGAWMTRLKGSGVGGKYSFEASPLVKNGIMGLGPADAVIDALRRYAAAGATDLCLRFVGDDQLAQLERFTTEVLPALRG